MDAYILAILCFFNILLVLASFKWRNTFFGIVSGVFFIVIGFLLVGDAAITFSHYGAYGFYDPVQNESITGMANSTESFTGIIPDFLGIYLAILGLGTFVLSIVYGVRGSKEEEDLNAG